MVKAAQKRKKSEKYESKLTERQKEIAYCLINGISPKEIASQLHISLYTVKGHQKDIKKKLACKSAYQAGYKLGFLYKKYLF